MADDQPGEWLNYEQAAELLGVSPEAARQKAIRGRWPRARGDDGKARLRLPEGAPDAVRSPSDTAEDQPGEWFTYEQAAELLGVSSEAARQKAIRGRWQRLRGNDGKARIRLPDGGPDAVRSRPQRARGD